MKKIIASCIIFLLFTLTTDAQIYLNWQRFTDGTAHTDDSAVAVDIEETATNVYVGGNVYNTGTGSDIVIRNYDLDGNLIWKTGYASTYNDRVAEITCNGLIYGAGNSDNGSYLIGLLISMDMTGKLLWSRTLNGSFAGDTKFLDIKIAPEGNIIVVGETQTGPLLYKGIVASYDSTGKLLWKKTAGGTSGESQFNRLEIDGTGNIYTSGFIYNGTNKDGYVAEYNKNGKLLNSVTLNGAGNKDDEVKGLEIMNGVLYFATVGRGSGSYDEATITAYDTADFSGLWEKNWHTLNGDINIAQMLCDDLNTNVVLIGVQGNFTSGTSDYLALSYDTAGALNWSRTISRGPGYNNIATAMALNAYGDLLITGATDLSGAHDYYTVGYDYLGNLLWEKVFNGNVNGDDYPTSIGADVNGDIFVAGTSALQISSASASPQGKYNLDFTLLKYSSKFICSIPTNLYSDSISSSFAWLHWDAMPEALKYKLQYRVVGGSWTSVNVVGNNKIITGLTAKTKYQWRVKTICSTNPAVSSDYSVIKSFTTLSGAFAVSSANGGDEALIEKPNVLRLFPNPATKMVSLQLNDISETSVLVKICDLSGKELKQYRFTAVSKVFNQQVDISALSPDSYVVVVSGSKQKWTQILVKQ